MNILKSIKIKIAFIEFWLIYLFVGFSLMEQISGISGYIDSVDDGAMGNRILRILDQFVLGKHIFFIWHLLIVVLGVLLAYASAVLIVHFMIHEKTWFLGMLHVLLYGMIFAAYGMYQTKYTNYGFAGIDLKIWNQFLILILEVVAIPLCIFLQEKKAVMVSYLSGRKKWAFLLILLYAGFACVGNALFLCDANKPWTFSFENVILYLLFSAWLTPYIGGVLLWLETQKAYRNKSNALSQRWNERKLLLVASLEGLIILLLYFIACNPGNMYTDAIEALREVYNVPVGEMSFAFPIAIKIFYKLVFVIFPYPVVVTLIQIVLAVLTEVAVIRVLYRKGVSPKRILIGTAVFNILPVNGIFIVTFTSNFYYTIACVFLFLLMTEVCETGDAFWKKGSNYLKLFFALVFLGLTRNEGMVVAALIAGIVFLRIMILFWKKIWPVLPVMIVFVAVLVVSGGFRLLLTKSLSAYATVNADLVNAVAYYEGQLPEETLFPDTIREEYTLYEVGNLSAYSYNNNYPDLVAEAIIKNPGIILRNRLNKSDCVWDVLENEGIHTAREIIGIYENDMGVTRQNNLLTVILIYMFYPITIAFCVTDVLFYRSGIYLILALILLLYWRKNCGQRGWLLLPALSHAFVLFICLLWQCSRHTYPVIICVLLAFVFSTLMDRNGGEKEENLEKI